MTDILLLDVIIAFRILDSSRLLQLPEETELIGRLGYFRLG